MKYERNYRISLHVIIIHFACFGHDRMRDIQMTTTCLFRRHSTCMSKIRFNRTISSENEYIQNRILTLNNKSVLLFHLAVNCQTTTVHCCLCRQFFYRKLTILLAVIDRDKSKFALMSLL